ncbi:hypothetical protein SPN99_000310 [Vibrio fluvialis]|nr:hypothetical protein [Vibrio fluvialis]ELZ1258177.1 hypothetical protein [Vibrio fluvialis]
MEISIKFKTSGSYLSMNSMYGVISDLKREIEKGIFDAMVEEYPYISKSSLKKSIRKNVDLYLTDAQKGSWEIFLGTVVAGAIGGVIANLSNDLIINSEPWKNLKSKIYSTSERSAENVKDRLDKKQKVGPFTVKNKDNVVIRRNDGTTKLELDLELENKGTDSVSFDVEAEVNSLIEQLKNRDK